MPMFKMIVTEVKTLEFDIEVEIEAENESDAAEKADAAYRLSHYDQALANAPSKTEACDLHVGYHAADGKYVRLF